MGADRGEGRKASKQASTSEAPRPPIAHTTKHILDPTPQSARSIWTKVSGCGPKEGGNTWMKKFMIDFMRTFRKLSRQFVVQHFVEGANWPMKIS